MLNLKRTAPITALLFAGALAGCATTSANQEAAMATDAPKAIHPAVSAIGIGVSDLEASRKFYGDTLGMREITRFNLDYMDEIVLAHPKGSAIVLMHWTDGSARNYKDNPIKIVLRIPDPQAVADKIRADGYEIVREPTPSEAVGGAIVGFAKDPDGYLIELLPPAG